MPKLSPETNPFLTNFSFKAIWRLEKPHSGIVIDTPGQGKGLYQVKQIDKEDRAQLFTHALFDYFKDLPASAKDMFIYIACHLGFETDVIELTEEKYCAEARVTSKTFYVARKVLVNHLIIPRTSRKNTYWVNVGWLYKGNRVEKLSEYARMENEHPIEKAMYKSADEYDPGANYHSTLAEPEFQYLLNSIKKD